MCRGGDDRARMARDQFLDDIPMQIGDLIRKGAIASVDLTAGTATVKIGDIITPELSWCELAGEISTWFPPSVGEQVMVLCMEADIESGVILRGLRTTTFPAPASGARAVLKMPDGATFEYDYQASKLIMTLPGSAELSAPDGLKITADMDVTGDVKITGKLDASGKITSATDVVTGSISLKNHKHGGVTAGAAKTAVPE